MGSEMDTRGGNEEIHLTQSTHYWVGLKVSKTIVLSQEGGIRDIRVGLEVQVFVLLGP